MTVQAGLGSPRDRLLAAARAVMAEEGLEGLTLRAIARRAGVSHGAPLRHFPTLARLLAAVAAQGFARLVEAVDEALDAAESTAAAEGRGPLDPIERLQVAGRTYVAVALADPGVFSVTFRSERCDPSDPDYLDQGARSFGQLLDLVAAAQGAGWHPDEPTDLLAAVVWSTVHGQAELAIHGSLDGAIGPGRLADVGALCGRLLFAPHLHPREAIP